MEFTNDGRPSRITRFADAALRFPGLRIIWWICTLGYSFPQIRRGENLAFCIYKNVVIFLVRFSCILGAIWYIGTWIQYVSLREDRPFNVLERQATQFGLGGTLVPNLSILSSETGKIKVENALYRNYTNTDNIVFQLTNDTGHIDPNQELLGVTMPTRRLIAGPALESVRVTLNHSLPFTAFGWTVVGLLHPYEIDSTPSDYDRNNQYYFQPGHFVEIHYTPIHFFQPATIGPENGFFENIKIFMGYGTQIERYSYESNAIVTPFMAGVFDALTTVVILRPSSTLEITYYSEEKVTFRDTMAKIGGLIGIVGSLIVFLFGASLMSPWGFIAGIPYFRERITRSMAQAYDTDSGLSKGPFTIRPEDIGKFEKGISTTEQRMILLKERVDELEFVLREYYLDGAVFQNYAERREENKLTKKVSLLRHGSGKASLGPSTDGMNLYQQQLEQQLEQQQYPYQQQQYPYQQQQQPPSAPPPPQQQQQQQPFQPQHQRLPSETMMESQYPPPQFSPRHARRPSTEQQQQLPTYLRRNDSEPGAIAYHQQLLQERLQKSRPNSERSLLRSMSEDDEVISPTQSLGMSEFEQQRLGLLQGDHNAWHQVRLEQEQQQQQQQQQRRPSAPPPLLSPRPKGAMVPMTINSTPQASLSGASETGASGGQVEYMNMSDLSKMEREH